MTPANIVDLLAGNLYVNIHSLGYSAGEIRGQILTRTVDVVAFTANGPQVVPPSATAATANCAADLDGPATGLVIQCTHNLAAPTSAHVHQAPFGVNGPSVFTFPSAASPLNANVPVTPALVASFAATFLYVDVHSATEEIRGQIGTPSPPPPGTIVIEKRTSPAGGTGFGFTENIPGGSGTFSLNHAGTQTFTSVTPGTHTVTENDPATFGYTLGDVSCDDTDSTGDVNTRAATITVGAGETVRCTFINVQTSPTDDLFVFHLSGDQAVPPVVTNARGGCMGRFDSAASELTLVCTHDVAAATLAHIHSGASGVSGPVVFDLGTSTSPLITTWSGMTPADIANLSAGNLYLDIHNAGVIRGQILPRTVDTAAFPADASQVVPPGGSAATANCTADLSTSADALTVNCTHDLAGATAAHVHQAPLGAIGPIAFAFPSPASPLNANMPMTPRLVADFAATFLYLDIHAAAEEIRGQLGLPNPVADLVVTKIGPATIAAGNNVSYDVTVANIGPSPAQSVTLTDPLPAGTTFVSITQNNGPAFNCTAPAGAVDCTIATLSSGASANFTIVYQVPAATAAGTILTNTATATTTTAELAPATNSDSASTTVSAGNVDLSVTKTTSAASYAPGQAVTYTITVSNAGPSPATGVTVTDSIPIGTVLVSATASQGTCSGTSTVICTLGTMVSGGSATISLILTLPTTPGTVVNTASAATSSPDTNAANNSGTSTITVISPALVAPAEIPARTPLALLLLALTIPLMAVTRLRR